MIRKRVIAAILTVAGLTACADLTPVRRVDPTIKKPFEDPLRKFTFGIDQSRESEKWLDGEYWIMKVPAVQTRAFANWFEPRAHTFPPVWIYAAARKFEKTGEYVRAARWYLIARERHVRHLRRCRDDTAKEQLTWADAAFADLRGVMARRPEITRYAAKHGFAWLDLHSDTDDGLLDVCLAGEKGQARVAQGTLVPATRKGKRIFILMAPPVADPANWVIPAGEIHQIRTWSRILMKQDVNKILGAPEELPPTPTMTPRR